jgi:SAM-dependent methyltransferase
VTLGVLRRTGAVGRAEVVVVDVEPPAGRPADASVRWMSRLEDAPGEFSLVLASAVLEHVPDLRDVLERLFARVAPGGFLYIRTPYVVPLARWLPGADLGFPAHVHDLGSEFWGRLPAVFNLPLTCLFSRPSPVAASWRRDPLRAAAASLLKLPALVEARLSAPSRQHRFWPWAGGWEALYRWPAAARLPAPVTPRRTR